MAICLYKLLHHHGLTKSKRGFSSEWCSKAPNYLAEGNGLSESAALAVARKLWRRGHPILFLRVLYEIVWGLDQP